MKISLLIIVFLLFFSIPAQAFNGGFRHKFGTSVILSAANTACTTTCGSSGSCLAGQDSGSSNVLVGCDNATADVCICVKPS